MSGKWIAGLLVAVSLAIGAGLWYSLNFSFYTPVTQQRTISAFGSDFPVAEFEGIDATSSPLKYRACFKVDWDYLPSEEFKGIAAPLRAPFWFRCFDAEQIGADLEAGLASALLAERNNPFGFDMFVAHYPDGRAYMWRQLNVCGRAVFSGDDPPEGCEKAEDQVQQGALSGAIVMRMAPVTGGPSEEVQADGLQVLRAPGDPNLLWACFTTPLSYGFITETYEILGGEVFPPEPAQNWPCFDRQTIQDDVLEGTAIAVLGEANVTLGYDRIIAVYEDGRAVAWHQKQAD